MGGLVAAAVYLSASSESGLGRLSGGLRGRKPVPVETELWAPATHVQFWVAITGGVLTFFHYLLLLKAFEGASSTVLLPLVQVASVATLLGSAAISVLRREAWITVRHLCAYALLFVGGARGRSGGEASASAGVDLRPPGRWPQASFPRATGTCGRSSARSSGRSRSCGAPSCRSSCSERTTSC